MEGTMEDILAWLTSFIKDPVAMQWLIYSIAALAGLFLALGLYSLFSHLYSPQRAELNKLQHKSARQAGQAQLGSDVIKRVLALLKHIPLLNRTFAGDQAATQLLTHAGFYSPNALKLYKAIKFFLCLFAAVAAFIYVSYFTTIRNLTTGSIAIVILVSGYLLPGLVLQKIASARITRLRKDFPEALDLLIVCCEAGLGLLEAFQRVKNELVFTQPRLSDELGLVCSKVRVGVSMQQALQEFSNRTGLQDIKGLNSVIVQSLKLGTGVACAIRVYATEYRDKRLQQAEESAAKLGVKMIFPTMFCIWPSFFIVAVGPAVLKVMNVWDKAF